MSLKDEVDVLVRSHRLGWNAAAVQAVINRRLAALEVLKQDPQQQDDLRTIKLFVDDFVAEFLEK